MRLATAMLAIQARPGGVRQGAGLGGVGTRGSGLETVDDWSRPRGRKRSPSVCLIGSIGAMRYELSLPVGYARVRIVPTASGSRRRFIHGLGVLGQLLAAPELYERP